MDRYWVGGGGTWDATTTTNWSATSGGAGGASAPTSADNVIFNTLSNATLYTVTVGTNAACADFTVTAPATGAVTFSLGATAVINCYGSMTLPASNCTFTITAGAILNFLATSTGKTITTNGVSLSLLTINLNGVGGEWTLGSALTASTTSIQNGSFVTNNFNLTITVLSSSAITTRSINLGSSTITCTNPTAINFTITTNLTFNAGTSQITCTNTSPTFAGGGLTFYNVTFSNTGGGTVSISGVNTFNNLTFTSRSATGQRTIRFSADQTVSGTLTLGAANTAIRRVSVLTDANDSQRTITLNGTLATLADVDFKDIATAGTAGTWTGTRLGNGGNNSGITFDAPKTVYWNLAGTQSWSATGWATTNNGTPAVNNFPLAQDTATFTEAGAAGTINFDSAWWVGSIQMADGVSNRTTAFTFATGAQSPIVFKDITLFSSLTLSGTGAILLWGVSTQTITSAGVTFTQPLTIFGSSATVRINGNLTTASAVTTTLTSGTLDLTYNGAGNYVLSTGVFSSTNTNTRSIAFGTGNITLTGNNATVLNMGTATGFTYTGTPTINCNYSGSVGTRGISFGTTAGFTEANAPNINVTAGSDIVNQYGYYKNINYTGFSGSLAGLTGSILMYGDLTLPATMTVTATTFSIFFFSASVLQKITTNGVVINRPITVGAVASTNTLELQDNLTLDSTRTFTLTSGTLDLTKGGTANLTLSTGLFSSSNSNARTIAFGTGTITATGTGTVWNAATSTNLTITGQTTGTIDCTSASTKTFAGGGIYYPKLNQGGAGALTITGNNTFYDVTNTVQPTTVTFTAGSTTNVSSFNLNGTAGNLVTLNSSIAGTQFFLNKI
jgi:fibronectin-binding autotransporter adhesin